MRFRHPSVRRRPRRWDQAVAARHRSVPRPDRPDNGRHPDRGLPGGSRPAVRHHLLEQQPQRLAQADIDGREGLIEQEHAWAWRQGTGQPDALSLSSGEGLGPPIGESLQLQALKPERHLPCPLGSTRQSVGDVRRHTQMREERIVLEQESNPALARWQIDSVIGVEPNGVAELDTTSLRRLQTRQEPQQGRLAAPGGPISAVIPVDGTSIPIRNRKPAREKSTLARRSWLPDSASRDPRSKIRHRSSPTDLCGPIRLSGFIRHAPANAVTGRAPERVGPEAATIGWHSRNCRPTPGCRWRATVSRSSRGGYRRASG